MIRAVPTLINSFIKNMKKHGMTFDINNLVKYHAQTVLTSSKQTQYNFCGMCFRQSSWIYR